MDNLYTASDVKKLKKNNPNIIDYEDYIKEDKVNIPDMDNLMNQVVTILQYLNEDENIGLSKKVLESKLVEKFPSFVVNYKTLTRMLLEDDTDMDMLFGLLNTLKHVKSGKVDMKDAEKHYGQVLAKKYIPPEIYNDPKFQQKMNEQ